MRTPHPPNLTSRPVMSRRSPQSGLGGPSARSTKPRTDTTLGRPSRPTSRSRSSQKPRSPRWWRQCRVTATSHSTTARSSTRCRSRGMAAPSAVTSCYPSTTRTEPPSITTAPGSCITSCGVWPMTCMSPRRGSPPMPGPTRADLRVGTRATAPRAGNGPSK